MTRRILIIAPEARDGQPVAERVKAFADFFRREEVEVEFHPSPASLAELVKLVHHIYSKGHRNVFLTMPPFRNWSICALPGVNIILDIRDGWSIAMKTGYGGTTRPRPFKALLAGATEQLGIRLSGLTIACTPGLARYLSTPWAKGKIVLVPNGFPDDDVHLVEAAERKFEGNKREERKKYFICAGKFSEYGKDRVKDTLVNISKNNKNYDCHVDVYNKSPQDDSWISDFLKESSIENIIFNSLGYISREYLFEKIFLSDYGITILRDPDYEIGTKVFDYIFCGKKIIVSPDNQSQFKEYFGSALDGKIDARRRSAFLRSAMIKNKRDEILGKIR